MSKKIDESLIKIKKRYIETFLVDIIIEAEISYDVFKNNDDQDTVPTNQQDIEKRTDLGFATFGEKQFQKLAWNI